MMPKMTRRVKGGMLAGLMLLLALGMLWRTMVAVCEQAPSPGNPDLQQELRDRVLELCAQPRFGESLHLAANYIEQELAAAGWTVRRQYFETNNGEFYNVVAERRGSQDGRYIIGAHYDACDSLGEAVNPGADDNASGVAVLLSLAKRLPQKPQHTLELVFYACEEPPWFDSADMGSAHHAAACNPQEVLGMICLEMLGCFRHDGETGRSFFPGSRFIFPKEDNFVAVIGDFNSVALSKRAFRALSSRMPTVRLNVPFAHDTELWFSDHRNYAPRGIPSIMVTDTAMLRNDNYHEASDTPDSLCYSCMAAITQALLEMIQSLGKEAP